MKKKVIRFNVLFWRVYYWLFTDYIKGITLKEFLFEEDVVITNIRSYEEEENNMKTKSMMNNIIKLEDIESKVPAYYSLLQDKVYYNISLDKFPILKEFVINHEKNHQRKPMNLFWHIYIDMRDNIKMRFTNNCIDLILFEREVNKKNVRKMNIRLALIFLVYPLIWGVICFMIKIIGFPSEVYYKHKIKKQELKMANELGQCFTPTSLWNHIAKHGTGIYHLIVDDEGGVVKSVTAKKK